MEKTELDKKKFSELLQEARNDMENGAFVAAKNKLWWLIKNAPSGTNPEFYYLRAVCNFERRSLQKDVTGYKYCLWDIDKACELNPKNEKYKHSALDFRLRSLSELEAKKDWNTEQLISNLDRINEFIDKSDSFSEFANSQKQRKARIQRKMGLKKWIANAAFKLADNLLKEKGESAELLYAKGVSSYHLRCDPQFDSLAANCFEKALELNPNISNEYECPMFDRIHTNFVLKQIDSTNNSNSKEGMV